MRPYLFFYIDIQEEKCYTAQLQVLGFAIALFPA